MPYLLGYANAWARARVTGHEVTGMSETVAVTVTLHAVYLFEISPIIDPCM